MSERYAVCPTCKGERYACISCGSCGGTGESGSTDFYSDLKKPIMNRFTPRRYSSKRLLERAYLAMTAKTKRKKMK